MRKNKFKKLLDVYNKPLIAGIIYDLFKSNSFTELFEILEIDEDKTHALDAEYFLNRSGLKTCSNLLCYLITGYVVDDDGNFVTDNNIRAEYVNVIDSIDKTIINTIITVRFKEKWIKLARSNQLEYDALKPFAMDSEEDLDKDNMTTHTNTSTDNHSTTSCNSAYGFNSSESVPTDESWDSSTYSDNQDYMRSAERHRTVTRKGNIGNIAPQDLLRKEREVLEYQFWDTVFRDLDSILTRSKYL